MTARAHRQSPSSSATLFPVGTIRTGNDGHKWRVESNKNGVRRWVRIGGTRNKTVKQTTKTTKAVNVVNAVKGKHTFNVFYKQSKACAGKEEGSCDPFPKIDNVLFDDFLWSMGFPGNPDKSMSEYDTFIWFSGPAESVEAVKDIVKKEYSKLKGKGAIEKFIIKDE